jgi:hypothetical protein
MASKNDYWTSHRKDGTWAVKREGTDRAASIHDTQADAWKEARRLARAAESEAFLKGRDGMIKARNTYSHDPYPPKG